MGERRVEVNEIAEGQDAAPPSDNKGSKTCMISVSVPGFEVTGDMDAARAVIKGLLPGMITSFKPVLNPDNKHNIGFHVTCSDGSSLTENHPLN